MRLFYQSLGVTRRSTRKATLYSGLETRAFVRATYLSPEFVAIQAGEISRVRAEPPAEAAARLARMLDENKIPSFFVALHTPDKTWNDWQEPKSVWRLAADMGHGQIDNPKVVRIERPGFSIEPPRSDGWYVYSDRLGALMFGREIGTWSGGVINE